MACTTIKSRSNPSGLTKRQAEMLERLHQEGFIECSSSFGSSQSNGPLWRLHEKGLCEFVWGPEGSFLKVQGFIPIPRDDDSIYKAIEDKLNDIGA